MRVLLALITLALSVSAMAETYLLPSPTDDLVGQMFTVNASASDTLPDLARTHDVGFDSIVRANPSVDPWLPGVGTAVDVPTWHILPDAPRKGIVLNLAELKLYFYPHPMPGIRPLVMIFPVGIGRMDWATPLGVTQIIARIPHPVWYPPTSIRDEHGADGDPLPLKVEAGPNNPLGEYAIQLGIPGYFLHGTNRPYGVGMRVSHGCVRLYPEDISLLFHQVARGTQVRIINEPYKAGWHDGKLFIEVHPLPPEGDSQDISLTPIVRLIIKATSHRPTRVDWKKVTNVATEARGIPVAVSY